MIRQSASAQGNSAALRPRARRPVPNPPRRRSPAPCSCSPPPEAPPRLRSPAAGSSSALRLSVGLGLCVAPGCRRLLADDDRVVQQGAGLRDGTNTCRGGRVPAARRQDAPRGTAGQLIDRLWPTNSVPFSATSLSISGGGKALTGAARLPSTQAYLQGVRG